MSLICLPANVGYTLQFLSVSQSPRKTKVLQMSAKLTCLTGSKKTTATGTRQTKDWGQLFQHLCEKCYASGWYGMLLHGNEVMRAWYRLFLVVYGPLSLFMVKYDGSWSFMVLHSHSIVWDGAGSCSVCSCLWFASQQTLGTLCSSCQFLNPHERPKCYRCPPNSPVWQDPRKPQPLVQDKPKTEDSFSSISVKSATLVDGMGCCCMVMRWWGHDIGYFWLSMVLYRYLWSSMMVHGHSWSFIVIL